MNDTTTGIWIERCGIGAAMNGFKCFRIALRPRIWITVVPARTFHFERLYLPNIGTSSILSSSKINLKEKTNIKSDDKINSLRNNHNHTSGRSCGEGACELGRFSIQQSDEGMRSNRVPRIDLIRTEAAIWLIATNGASSAFWRFGVSSMPSLRADQLLLLSLMRRSEWMREIEV